MSPRPNASVVPPMAIDRYDALLASLPGTQRRGATMPYTSLNGHMFSFLAPDGSLAIRLGTADRDPFLDAHTSRLVEQHGRVMKEYVAVPDELFALTDELGPGSRAVATT